MCRVGFLTGLLLVSATAAAAKLPDPSKCVVPRTMVFCPGGDLAPTVVVKDFANNTVAGSSVVMDLVLCAGERYCANPFPDPAIRVPAGQDQKATGFTVLDGSLAFRIAMSGTCPDGESSLYVFADGVFLASPPMASPDQNGDFVVDAADEAIVTAKVAGGVDPTADLDGNGSVDNQDLDVFRAHVGHGCDSQTRTRRSRWGELKLLYR